VYTTHRGRSQIDRIDQAPQVCVFVYDFHAAGQKIISTYYSIILFRNYIYTYYLGTYIYHVRPLLQAGGDFEHTSCGDDGGEVRVSAGTRVCVGRGERRTRIKGSIVFPLDNPQGDRIVVRSYKKI